MKPSPQLVEKLFQTLLQEFPEPKTELVYDNPFQLLIAVILSAQCTDERVNKTTPALFAQFPTAEELATADLKVVEKLIHSCGFYRAKARAITTTARDLLEKFSGQVPQSIEELTTLRGVGRKTASVVLNQAYNIPAIAVDTHVKRVSQRLGWAKHEDPEKIEFELRALVPKALWATVNTLLILHGRRTCQARKPKCEACRVSASCPSAQSELLPPKAKGETAPRSRPKRKR